MFDAATAFEQPNRENDTRSTSWSPDFEVEHAWTQPNDPEPWSEEELFRLTRQFAEDPSTWDGCDTPVDLARIRVEFDAIARELDDRTADPITALLRQARLVAHHQACLYESIASVIDAYELEIDDPNVDSFRGAAAEIAGALMSHRRSAESDVELAWRLRDRHPSVLASLGTGDIDLARAKVIVGETTHLSGGHAESVVDAVLPRAPRMTTAQLRALIRRLCIDLDPEHAVQRSEAALAERAVSAELTEDHTGTITASNLPADRVASIMGRIDTIARSLRHTDGDRTMDQLRADVFCDLLEGRRTSQQAGSIDIRVDLTTLAGLDDRSAELSGYGPVVADVARQMTERFGPSWRVGVTDPAGDLIMSSVTRRRPDGGTRRHVQMRDQGCVFPGCRAPAQRCDLDHCIPYSEGGTTHRHQMYALCRYHHVNRHRYRWTHVRRDDGSHEWRSPLGNTYIRPPP